MAIDLRKNRCTVYEGDEPYIFVSYSHKDMKQVVSLILKLQSLGFRIWYDSGVPAGAEWPEEIATHLKNSGCILSLLSANAAKSRHFKEEFNYAHYLKKPILVSYLEDCELTPGVEMRVVSQQCIKCENCKDDDDLLEQIALAKILVPCLGEESDAELSAEPTPQPKAKPVSQLKKEQKSAKATIDSLREKAEQGDKKAQYDLGQAFFKGNCIEQNLEEAVNWYRKAADQGHTSALYNLGVFYHYGRGVTKNLQEAVRLYQAAADRNHKGALNNLAVCYERGEGVQRNMSKALDLYREAAELGNDLAAQNLGKCYEFSKGTEQDWEQAVQWYQIAAENGKPYSQQKLAQCYRDGLGVPADKEKAEYWQKKYNENPNKK